MQIHLKSFGDNRFPKEKQELICEMYNTQGLNLRQIGKDLNCNAETIRLILIKNEIPRRKRLRKEKIKVEFVKRSGCLVPGCDKPHLAFGLCQTHYMARRLRIERGIEWTPASLLIRLPGGVGNGQNTGEKNYRWNGGTSEYPNHYTMKKVRLEKLKEQNYTCELCGSPAKEVHHKDKTKTNHDPSNFIVVCHPCHMRVFHRDVVGRKKGGKNKKHKTINELFNLKGRTPKVLQVHIGQNRVLPLL